MRKYKHHISEIFVFHNGMVAVFDQNEQQMPFFQGHKDEAMPKIKRRLSRQKGVVTWNGVDNLQVSGAAKE